MSKETPQDDQDIPVAIRLLARAMMTDDPIDRSRACKFIEERLGSIDEIEIRKVLGLD